MDFQYMFVPLQIFRKQLHDLYGADAIVTVTEVWLPVPNMMPCVLRQPALFEKYLDTLH